MPDDTKPEDKDVDVRVPGPLYRMPPGQTALWHSTGELLEQAVTEHGPEMAFSVMLSRLSRELRRTIGLDEAKAIFHKLAETMDEAAQYDR